MITVCFLGEIATLDRGVWRCENPTVERILRNLARLWECIVYSNEPAADTRLVELLGQVLRGTGMLANDEPEDHTPCGLGTRTAAIARDV